MKRYLAALLVLVSCRAMAAQNALTTQPSLDPRFDIGEVLFSDDFTHGDEQWTTELERGGTVRPHDGKLEIDVPAGCTVWFKPQISAPALIEYEATVLSGGGPNDRVSDLNCFWMATDSRAANGDVFDVKRSGKFADYNALRCYYVGLGGNGNTTTRFRRYIGSPTTRPLLPEHDLNNAPNLITPNVRQKIQLVTCGTLVQYWRDGKRVFEYTDADPYKTGRFAFRTVTNHMTIENFRVMRLNPRAIRAMASGQQGPAQNLRVEYQTNPIGLTETKPRFSWWINDDR
ncbi:MAG TPA: DUF6250 domain-containing protein, partial [Tepidisphaeraceae bacterium]